MGRAWEHVPCKGRVAQAPGLRRGWGRGSLCPGLILGGGGCGGPQVGERGEGAPGGKSFLSKGVEGLVWAPDG